jgi:2-octaprenyl-6-methoxyphenol hydroxylase
MPGTANFESIVVGTGPAGLAAALALAAVGAEAAVVGPPPTMPPQGDTRTAALFAGSIELLRNVGVWDAVARESAPLRAIRIIDDTGGLLRAPEVLFEAREVGLDVFGYNVPNSALHAALHEGARRDRRVRVVETAAVAAVDLAHGQATLRTADGARLTAKLIVGADGRRSICRSAAGIGTHSWAYEQSAIATRFSHGRAHDGVSNEFHRRAGPCTTVPLPELASSLVWVERPAIAQHVADMSDAAFRAALEGQLHGLLGTLGDVGPRRVFPLSGLTADRFAQNRVALAGEAGHVLPPIGAQGLNLSLRDAAVLAQCVAEARRRGDDVGGPGALARYHELRRLDVGSRRLAVDALNRTLLADLLPVHLLRGAGLHLIRAISPLKRTLMHQGLEPFGAQPLLMQPGGGGLLAR